MSAVKPTKEAALWQFWNSFGIDGYEENTVPSDVELPYLTYQVSTDSRFQEVPLAVNVYYRDNSWLAINDKVSQISAEIQTGCRLDCMGGWIWLKKGSPFAQNMSDSSDDTIRRKYLNITAEYCTNL